MNQKKRWQIAPSITPQANESLIAFPPILRQILFNRGYATDVEARAFINARLLFDTSPWQMTGMKEAVERVISALQDFDPVAIYGDYDVDGVTATALLVQTLDAIRADILSGSPPPADAVRVEPAVCGYIPRRFEEGYGLNNDAFDKLKAEGRKVVITVDCGIRSPDEAAHAKDVGLDLIITDHHQPADGELPPAIAIINPKQTGDIYPDKDLSGVGVAFKLAQALLEKHPVATLSTDDLLDLVALGTVADLVPLTGENRLLVRNGLKRIRQTQRQGLFSLANVAGLSLPTTNTTHIGFILGPRLNAAGRLDSALAAFDLLTTTDVSRAGNLALELDAKNRERQAMTRTIQETVQAIADTEDPESYLIFAVDENFNQGVVGLAASRLVDVYYKPAVVGQIIGEATRCSCRSIPEFHITQALDQCRDLLLRHGGHAAAAGFTVLNENRDALKARLKAIAAEQLKGQDLRPRLVADVEVTLSDLKPELLTQLDYLQPTGYGNPEAVFVSRNVRIQGSRVVGADGKHLKLTLTDGHLTFDAIGFRLGEFQPDLPPRVDVIFTFEANEYNGRKTLQLNLKDIKPAGEMD